MRLDADEHKHTVSAVGLFLPGGVVSYHDRLEPLLPLHRQQLRVQQELDPVVPDHFVGEVLCADRLRATNHNRHLAGEPAEIEGPLGGGVGTADHEHVLPLVEVRFGVSCPIVDARPGEIGGSRHLEGLEQRSCGHEDGVRRDFSSVGQRHNTVAVLNPHPGRFLRH